MEVMTQVINRVRGLRTELGLAPKARLEVYLDAADPATASFLAEQAPLIGFLCRAETVQAGAGPEGGRRDVVGGVEITLVTEAQEISDEERQRLEKELEKLETEIARAEERLGNEQFLSKAPPHVVEGGRARLAEMKERRSTLRSSLGIA
jgi:valyl-tRNA synthetase